MESKKETTFASVKAIGVWRSWLAYPDENRDGRSTCSYIFLKYFGVWRSWLAYPDEDRDGRSTCSYVF